MNIFLTHHTVDKSECLRIIAKEYIKDKDKDKDIRIEGYAHQTLFDFINILNSKSDYQNGFQKFSSIHIGYYGLVQHMTVENVKVENKLRTCQFKFSWLLSGGILLIILL